MKIAMPIVHLKRDTGPNSSTIYYLHAVTWMDQTRFQYDGHEELPEEIEDGVFPVVLKIKENVTIPDIELLTPIVHTIFLNTVDFGEQNICVDVTVINTSDSNSEVGKRKTHTDDAEDSTEPTPALK